MSKKMYSFRFDSELVEKVKLVAKAERRSLNNFLENKFDEFVKDFEFEEKEIKPKEEPDNWVELDEILDNFDVSKRYIFDKMKENKIPRDEIEYKGTCFNVKSKSVNEILGL